MAFFARENVAPSNARMCQVQYAAALRAQLDQRAAEKARVKEVHIIAEKADDERIEREQQGGSTSPLL